MSANLTKKPTPTPTPTIVVPDFVRTVIHYAAVEVYPKESFGWLIGEYLGANRWVVSAAIPIQVVNGRSVGHVDTHVLAEEALELVLEDHVIGDFHSHTSCPVALSKCDRADILDSRDWCFIVAGIKNSARHSAQFSLRLGGYAVVGKHIRRAVIE